MTFPANPLSLVLLGLASLGCLIQIKGSDTPPHSTCYHWYHKGNHPGQTGAPIKAAMLRSSTMKQNLRPRTDVVGNVKYTAGGNGVCGEYDTTAKMGVCLWTGTDSLTTPGFTPGWLTGTSHQNCGNIVWLQAKPNGPVSYATVVDGCGLDGPSDIDSGCAGIYLTEALFRHLGGNVSAGFMELSKWDFDQKTPGY